MNSYCDALMDVAERPPVTMMEGSGAWLTDQHNKHYLDFVQGLGCQLPRPLTCRNRCCSRCAGTDADQLQSWLL